MKIKKIKIFTKSKKYPIVIGNNIIKNLKNYLSINKVNSKKISLIIDQNVPKKNIKIG